MPGPVKPKQCPFHCFISVACVCLTALPHRLPIPGTLDDSSPGGVFPLTPDVDQIPLAGHSLYSWSSLLTSVTTESRGSIIRSPVLRRFTSTCPFLSPFSPTIT